MVHGELTAPTGLATAELPFSGVGEHLLWLLRRRRRFRVSGESMRPQLPSGSEVLLDPRAYIRDNPKPGDIVVARHPFKSDVRIVKRVAGLHGDEARLVGDNPSESTDSDVFGGVPMRLIVGRVTSRFSD